MITFSLIVSLESLDRQRVSGSGSTKVTGMLQGLRILGVIQDGPEYLVREA